MSKLIGVIPPEHSKSSNVFHVHTSVGGVELSYGNVGMTIDCSDARTLAALLRHAADQVERIREHRIDERPEPPPFRQPGKRTP